MKLFGGSFGVDIEESGLVFNLQGSALRNPEVSDLELELEPATTDYDKPIEPSPLRSRSNRFASRVWLSMR